MRKIWVRAGKAYLGHIKDIERRWWYLNVSDEVLGVENRINKICSYSN